MSLRTAESEFASNPEPRCACVLILDTSYSMAGNKITQLNAGLQTLFNDLRTDNLAMMRVEPAIITFGPDVRLQQDFTTVEAANPPQLKADGGTPLLEAVDFALDHLQKRRKYYDDAGLARYRPWILLLTDGEPNSENNLASVRDRIAREEQAKGLTFFPIGVDGADMDFLKRLSPNRSPLPLQGLHFKELFAWLSASMKLVSRSNPGDPIQIPSTDPWRGAIIS